MSKRRNTTSAAKYTPPALEEKAAREKHAYAWRLLRKCWESELEREREYLEATGERMPTDPIGWARAAAKYGYPNYGQGVYSEGAIYAWVVKRAREHAAAPDQHIRECPQHPMRQVEAERDEALRKLDAALREL